VTNKLPYGIPQNKAGEYIDVGQSVEGVQNAMSDFGTNLGDKLAISIVDAPSKNSYPIAGYTYLLNYMDQTDCAKGKKFIEFFKWALTDGTKDATDLKYVPLPDDVKQQVLQKLEKMTCQGNPL
jgi:phosphate transport system substrate-binding protein